MTPMCPQEVLTVQISEKFCYPMMARDDMRQCSLGHLLSFPWDFLATWAAAHTWTAVQGTLLWQRRGKAAEQGRTANLVCKTFRLPTLNRIAWLSSTNELLARIPVNDGTL
jgi:hypothetical protein